MNPLDKEIFSLFQDINLAIKMRPHIPLGDTIDFRLPKLIRRLSPKAQGRLNRDLDRKSTRTLIKSLNKIYSRLHDVLEIHTIGAHQNVLERINSLAGRLKQRNVLFCTGGTELDVPTNILKSSKAGIIWIHENNWRLILNEHRLHFEVSMVVSCPAIYHWCVELFFAYGFNPVFIPKPEYGKLLPMEVNGNIISHMERDLLQLHQRILLGSH